MEQNARIYQDLERILVTKDEISRKVRELGQKITADYAGKEPVLVCILKGAVMFFSDLIREIDLPLTADFMAISSYGSATKTSGVVRVLKDLDKDILGKDVIISNKSSLVASFIFIFSLHHKNNSVAYSFAHAGFCLIHSCIALPCGIFL